MSLSLSEKTERRWVFGISFLLGAVIFIMIYGPHVLDPFCDDWIMAAADRDLAQHYLGFCLYRSSPWQFPLGLITTASYPHDMSVIYTDSIPLLAFLFKLISPLLPQIFQYLGIYGMISMALMGGMGGLLIHRLTHRADIAVIASILYTLSWTVQFRMFYHTSLTSQWLILIAIYLWLTVEPSEHMGRNLTKYALLSGAAILIHPYIWAMCAGITLMSQAEYLIKSRDIKKVLAYTGTFIVTGILLLYIFGGFAGDTKANLGVGTYEANLNSLYNSMELAYMPGFPVALAQYEGFAYLGAGVFFLLICAAGILLVERKLPHMGMRRVMLTITAALFFIFSLLPEISLNDRVLLDLDLGRAYRAFAGIFRSNGRFIWPVWILIVSAAVVYVTRKARKKTLLILMILVLLIQIVDMIPFIRKSHSTYATAGHEYTDPYETDSGMERLAEGREHIVMDLGNDVGLDQSQAVSYYAYKHGMTTNDFYYARPIGDKVNGTREELMADMREGRYDDSLLYVLGEDTLPLYRDFDLNIYEVAGKYVALHEKNGTNAE